jgi:DMSO/TMAO reductase YedYZ molybdopterin-dependent catalytic subunit
MMKQSMVIIILMGIISAGCGGGTSEVGDPQMLLVGDGSKEKTYSVGELKELPASEAVYNGVSYIGVPLAALLTHAGFDPQAIQVVNVEALDGYSVNYDSDLFMREDVLVAYAQIDGDLTADDGTFRMVLPGEEGKLNLRMMVQITVTHK